MVVLHGERLQAGGDTVRELNWIEENACRQDSRT
jgi:hypothetical protein